MDPSLHLPFADLTYWPSADALELSWRRPPSSAELRHLLLRGVRLAYQFGVRVWISDVQHLGAVGADDQAWLSTVWLPRLADTTVEALAVVVPLAPLQAARLHLAMEQLSPMGPVLYTCYFDSVDDARRWAAQWA